jgi:hypothetical protein
MVNEHSYGLDDQGYVPDRGRNFSLPYHVHADSIVHSASYKMDTEGCPQKGRHRDIKLATNSHNNVEV